MFNENSQSLSPWACWSRVGEFAHVSFGCRSTTASRTAETMREPGRDSSRQQNTTGQTGKRRGRKRRRKRKCSHAPGIKNLPDFGSLREGGYDLKPAQYCVRCIRTLTGDILSIFTALNVISLLTVLRACVTYCCMLWKLLSVNHVGETKGWLSAPTEPVC